MSGRYGFGDWIAEEYDSEGRVLRVVFCDSEEGARTTCAYWERVRGSRTEVFANVAVTA